MACPQGDYPTIVNIKTGERTKVIPRDCDKVPPTQALAACYSIDGNYLYIGDLRGYLQIFNMETQEVYN